MRNRNRLFIVMLTFTAAFSHICYSQDKEVIPLSELSAVLELGRGIAAEVADSRSKYRTEVSAEDFLRIVANAQELLETFLIKITETRPQKEHQLYAMQIAIGIKEVELALWKYMYAFLSNQQAYFNKADGHLREGLQQLQSVE